jgi:hypothetical protein
MSGRSWKETEEAGLWHERREWRCFAPLIHIKLK